MPEAQLPVIWIIDNNHWERVNIRALLIERGYTVEGFTAIARAMLAFYSGLVEKPRVVVLETKNLTFDPAELKGIFRLDVPVLLLTGVFENFAREKWAGVLKRPFTVGNVADRVESLAGSPRPPFEAKT